VRGATTAQRRQACRRLGVVLGISCAQPWLPRGARRRRPASLPQL